MAFKIGSFLGGFAEAASEDKRQKEDEIRDLVKASYADTLSEAKELRKERKAKREALKDLGRQLKAMNMSDAQVAGVLSNGVEGAKHTLDALRTTAVAYGKAGKQFDVNTFVTASEDANMSIDDAVDKIMGNLKAGEATMPDVADQETFFGSTRKFAEGQMSQLQKAFGEDLGTLQAEVRGDYEYGDIPAATIDYQAMGLPDPMADLQKREAELEIDVLEAELKKAKEDGTAGALKSSDATKAKKEIYGRLAAEMQIDLKYDDETGSVTTTKGSADQVRLATQLADKGMVLMQAFGGSKNFVNAYQQTIDMLIPQAIGTPNLDANDNTDTVSSTDTSDQPAGELPAFSANQNPDDYIRSASNILNVTSLNARQKANARTAIVRKLLAANAGLSPVEARKKVRNLIP